MASLLAIVSTSLMIPAALNVAYENRVEYGSLNSILILSRGTIITLIILYVLYLYFQLKIHIRLFEGSTTGLPQEGVDEFQEPKKVATRVLSPQAAVATLLAISVIIAI